MRRYVFLLSTILLLTLTAVSQYSDLRASAQSNKFNQPGPVTKQPANQTAGCGADSFNRFDLGTGMTPVSAVSGDIDGDGDSDLAVVNRGSQSVSIFYNSNGQFDEKNAVTLSFPDLFDRDDLTVTAVTASDYNNDGRADLAISAFNNEKKFGQIINIFGADAKGIAEAGNFRQYVATPGIIAILTADFDNDKLPDLATLDGESNLIGLFRNDSTFFLNGFLRETGGIAPTAFTVGDFNGDGNNDLAVTNGFARLPQLPSTISLLLNNGDGTLASSGTLLEVPRIASAIASGDFNRDSRPDLAVASSEANRVSILHNDAPGKLSLQPDTIAVGKNPSAMVVGDFNNDGLIDLAVANQDDNSVSLLFGDGEGNFTAGTVIPVGEQPVSLHAVDLNKDGRQDLIVVNRGSNSVTILRNSCSNVVADFNLNIDPNMLKTKRGQKGTFTANIQRTGNFAEKVTITAPDTKSLKIKLTQSSVSNNGDSIEFNFKVKNSAAKGEQQLIFTATDSTGRVRTGILNMIVE